MKRIISCVLIWALSFQSYSQVDSFKTTSREIQEKIKILENRTDELRRDQLNYSLEKNLLKETYSNNYETINFVLTIILGIVGILGFLGIRDISSIKKEYGQELEKLRAIKLEFDSKLVSFDQEKIKFDTDIKDILKQNEEQNKKIKLLELKDKVTQLMKEQQNATALEYCSVALELSVNDTTLINNKAILKCRLNQFAEGIEDFKKVCELEPRNQSAKANYIECLLFANQIQEAKELINANLVYLTEKEDGKLLPFFTILEKYHTEDTAQFLLSVKQEIDLNNLEATVKRFSNWLLSESMYFAYYQPHSDKKEILQNFLWYLEGTLNAKTVCERLNIPI